MEVLPEHKRLLFKLKYRLFNLPLIRSIVKWMFHLVVKENDPAKTVHIIKENKSADMVCGIPLGEAEHAPYINNISNRAFSLAHVMLFLALYKEDANMKVCGDCAKALLES